MKKYILGIDPGKDGAVTLIHENGKVEIIGVVPKIGKEFDTNEFNLFIDAWKNDIKHAYIELVHAIFGSAAGATFTFGKVCGLIEGIIVAHKIPYTLIQPKKWQSEMFEGIPEQRKPSKMNKNGKLIKGKLDTKVMSELACKRLFPDYDFRRSKRCKNIHDGMTDSALIAEYGRRKLFSK